MGILYRPTIHVLHVEDRPRYWKALARQLIERGMFVHTVHTRADALAVLKRCDVEILVSDGMFPRETGGREEKSFIPLQEDIASLKLARPPATIAWANSTHVHEYCRSKGLAHFSKQQLTAYHFERRGRAFFPIRQVSARTLAEIIQEHFFAQAGLERLYGSRALSDYYTEPATVFAIFMAADMRTGLFKNTAGRNYGPMASIVQNGVFSLVMDASNDAAIAREIFRKFKTTDFFRAVKRSINQKSRRLLSFARSLKMSSHRRQSNEGLARLYLTFVDLFMDMRTYSSLPTALEHGTNMWTSLLTGVLQKKIFDAQELNRVLSALTTPDQFSYLKVYEHELARAALAGGRVREAQIKKIVKNFAWIRYAFQGVPITAKDVRAQIKERVRDAWERAFSEDKTYARGVKKKKRELMRAYRLNRVDQKLFQIGADIVFIKYYRKGVFAESYYSVEFLFEEIARRIGVARDDVSQMTAQEVLAALAIGSFPVSLPRNRFKRSVLFHCDGHTLCFGPSAEQFIHKVADRTEGGTELAGQVAYPGHAHGRVRIVNAPAELSHFKRGEIMVSRSTNPSLISAMQKAAAIVTDLGGLTCHAAIVARELKKPCVVGTKHATGVLKNGDRIDVDADRGIVRVKV